MSKTDYEILREMPKVELHCHLDGSLRPQTVLDLAPRQKIALPADTLEELKPHITVSPTCQSLSDCLKVFELLYPMLRDPASFERVAYELIEDCAAENVRHVEVRFAPALQAHGKFPLDEVIASALRGLRRGKEDFGTTSGVILCLFRAHGPQENRAVLDALKRFYRPENGLDEPGVVGLDLAGDETRFPIRDFADFFEEAHRHGIRTTCHAGEAGGGADNLRGVLALGINRIGHGILLAEHPELLRRVVESKTPLEIQLTSNLRTRSVEDLAFHPLRRFCEAGARVSLNSDDRGIFAIDLSREYRLARDMGFSLDELFGLSAAAADQLFLPEPDRARLKTALGKDIAALREAHRIPA